MTKSGEYEAARDAIRETRQQMRALRKQLEKELGLGELEVHFGAPTDEEAAEEAKEKEEVRRLEEESRTAQPPRRSPRLRNYGWWKRRR